MTAPLGFYIHVPFCSVRCGYCDFNTYTNHELGGGGSRAEFPELAREEIRRAARVLAEFQPDTIVEEATGSRTRTGTGTSPTNVLRPVSSVFFGGGTPTLLDPHELASLLAEVRDAVGIEEGAEVTTEANPDSVDDDYLEALAEAGFTRMSVGMQSSVTHVLRTLDRTHNPDNVRRAVAGAKKAGLDVSVDLIYGTPGESESDWRASLEAVIELEPGHISAYALGIEPGTQMGRQVARGEMPGTDGDDQAAKYLIADEMLAAAGYKWYEISNWARPGKECRHNLAYWRGQNWWGVGPGAHSHVEGVRWWNVKHPRTYAVRLAESGLPVDGAEALTDAERDLERVMLELRLPAGIATETLSQLARQELPALADEGLITREGLEAGRVQLTLRGRLLADAVTRRITD